MSQKKVIAFLGPEGTYSHQAVLHYFGEEVSLLPLPSFQDVFEALISSKAHYGMIPYKNSTTGLVRATQPLLKAYDISYCDEVVESIHHGLLVHPQYENLEVLYAHEEALAQCKKWLKQHKPLLHQEAVSSNAQGAVLVTKNPHAAAIGNQWCATYYGLKLLYENIADLPHNETHFYVVKATTKKF